MMNSVSFLSSSKAPGGIAARQRFGQSPSPPNPNWKSVADLFEQDGFTSAVTKLEEEPFSEEHFVVHSINLNSIVGSFSRNIFNRLRRMEPENTDYRFKIHAPDKVSEILAQFTTNNSNMSVYAPAPGKIISVNKVLGTESGSDFGCRDMVIEHRLFRENGRFYSHITFMENNVDDVIKRRRYGVGEYVKAGQCLLELNNIPLLSRESMLYSELDLFKRSRDGDKIPATEAQFLKLCQERKAKGEDAYNAFLFNLEMWLIQKAKEHNMLSALEARRREAYPNMSVRYVASITPELPDRFSILDLQMLKQATPEKMSEMIFQKRAAKKAEEDKQSRSPQALLNQSKAFLSGKDNSAQRPNNQPSMTISHYNSALSGSNSSSIEANSIDKNATPYTPPNSPDQLSWGKANGMMQGFTPESPIDKMARPFTCAGPFHQPIWDAVGGMMKDFTAESAGIIIQQPLYRNISIQDKQEFIDRTRKYLEIYEGLLNRALQGDYGTNDSVRQKYDKALFELGCKFIRHKASICVQTPEIQKNCDKLKDYERRLSDDVTPNHLVTPKLSGLWAGELRRIDGIVNATLPQYRSG